MPYNEHEAKVIDYLKSKPDRAPSLSSLKAKTGLKDTTLHRTIHSLLDAGAIRRYRKGSVYRYEHSTPH